MLYEPLRRDIQVRYKQIALVFAWAVLMPSLIVLAGATVRFAMAYLGGRHTCEHFEMHPKPLQREVRSA